MPSSPVLAWLHAPAAELSRPPGAAPGGVFGWIVLGISVLALVLIVRARRRARRSGRPHGVSSLRGGTSVGNALFDLGAVLQPDRPDAAVIRRLDEEGEHDDRGDGRDPERRRTRSGA